MYLSVIFAKEVVYKFESGRDFSSLFSLFILAE